MASGIMGASSFAQQLRRLRSTAGLTQEALAERSGLSVDAISALENGRRRRPRFDTVSLLAMGLALTRDERERLAAARATSPAGERRAACDVPVPRELPRAPADFTGRAAELALLRRLLDPTGPGPDEPDTPHVGARRPIVIAAIDGMGGIGKSALAVQTAHQLIGAFPDGQLYLDLQGATPGSPPLTPLAALSRMLRSLGVPPAATPADVDEASALFRSLTAERRLLLLLDNVRGPEQIRPLLPGGRANGILITSREALVSLEGVQMLHLDGLPEEHALELLGRVAGRSRVSAEVAAALGVLRWCGRLPLAIRIAGARLARRPSWRIRDLERQLADATRRLVTLEVGELAVRATFDVSVRLLLESPDPVDRAAADAFGLMSLPEGPDLALATVAHLLDQPEIVASTVLERLVDAQLLDSPQPARYRFHDLVRLYAREHAANRITRAARRAALRRTMAFYVAGTWGTLAILRPGDPRLSAAAPERTSDGLEFRDAETALGWLEAERGNLVAAVEQSGRMEEGGLPGNATAQSIQLAQALSGFFYTRGHWHDWVTVNETAGRVAARIGERAARARAFNDLGIAHEMLGGYDRSIACLRESLAIYREIGDRQGSAGALNNLAVAHRQLGQFGDAMDCLRQSLPLFRQTGNRRGQVNSLTNHGKVHERLGRYSEAIAYLQESLHISREVGDRTGSVEALNVLGVVHQHLGQIEAAIACFQESHELSRQIGNQFGQAESLNRLGVVSTRAGRWREALACLRDSVALFHALGSRRGEALALRDLGDALDALGQGRQARRAWDAALTAADALQIPEIDEIRVRSGRGSRTSGT
jgi:tetratricopeptide (TPR) repeat protein/transcriptional regulator with XRE-family HTH domain